MALVKFSMEIVNFFKKQEGRWFSQKTTHYLQAGKSKAGKSDLEVTYVPAEDPALQQLVQIARTEEPLGGLRINHTTTVGPQSEVKSLLLAAVGTERGQLLQKGDAEVLKVSQYRWESNALVIESKDGELSVEERWWFITDNIRMRTSVIHDGDTQTLASFCSEIRLGDVKA